MNDPWSLNKKKYLERSFFLTMDGKSRNIPKEILIVNKGIEEEFLSIIKDKYKINYSSVIMREFLSYLNWRLYLN